MDSRRIFIANLSKGVLGDEPSNLIGSLLVSEFQRAAMGRVSQPQDSRRDFTLIIDEFQNFTTTAFASILSEARKFRLSLVLSHQFISQLQPPMRDAVLGNVGTTVCFQLGATDAEIMANEYGEAFVAKQFVDLARSQILVKPCIIDGFDSPFRARTEITEATPTDAKNIIIRASQERYASERMKVENKIKRWIDRWSEK